jgi:hypothetical protein
LRHEIDAQSPSCTQATQAWGEDKAVFTHGSGP